MENPNYYAIIPADVRYCKTLPANAKLLYGEITALCNKEGFCWASNGYFAKLYKVRNETISIWIKALKKNNFIEYEIKNNFQRKIFLTKMLKKIKKDIKKTKKEALENSKGVLENSNGGIRKITKGVLENSKHNNKSNIKERERERTHNSSSNTLLNRIVTYYHQEISKITTSGKTVVTEGIRPILIDKLQEFQPEELILAIKGFSSEDDQWQMKHNGARGLKWFFKDTDRLERYIGLYNKNRVEEFVKDATKYLSGELKSFKKDICYM